MPGYSLMVLWTHFRRERVAQMAAVKVKRGGTWQKVPLQLFSMVLCFSGNVPFSLRGFVCSAHCVKCELNIHWQPNV